MAEGGDETDLFAVFIIKGWTI